MTLNLADLAPALTRETRVAVQRRPGAGTAVGGVAKRLRDALALTPGLQACYSYWSPNKKHIVHIWTVMQEVVMEEAVIWCLNRFRGESDG